MSETIMEQTHVHDPVLGLDRIMRCRGCGEMLERVEETITKTQSEVSARKIQDEVAVAGNYTAASFQDGFLVYSKVKDGLRLELSLKQTKSKEYLVIKRITKEGE